MKKALQISIAQTLFTIEEDAYAILDKYLASIRAHFHSTEGNADIVSDIESRIAEQFNEMGTKIVTLKEVEAVMNTMGRVEDFGSADSADGAAAATDAGTAQKESKKLYRDLDKKIIAGVCSGLGAYIGVDALWVRIIFVVLTFATQGFGIILYIVLACIMPAAKTASQKLEMEGTPVTLDTISKNVKEKATEISNKHGSTIMRILAAPFVALKWIVDGLVRFVGPLIRTIVGAILVAISVIGMIVLTFLAPVSLMNGSTYVGFPITEVVSSGIFYAAIASAYVALVIPCVVIFMLALSLLRRKIFLKSTLALTLLFLWCIAVAGAGVTGVTMGERISKDPRVDAVYGSQTIEYPISAGVRNIAATGNMRITYTQSTTPSFTVTGRPEGIKSLATSSDTTALTLNKSRLPETSCIFCESNWLEVRIALPQLSSVTLDRSADFEADSWKSTNTITLDAYQGSHADINVYVPEITINARSSYVRVSGTASTTNLTKSSGGNINTYELNDSELDSVRHQ